MYASKREGAMTKSDKNFYLFYGIILLSAVLLGAYAYFSIGGSVPSTPNNMLNKQIYR